MNVNVHPPWLERLTKEKFYDKCRIHKNENNQFCLQCNHSFCEGCGLSHLPHQSLRVRKHNTNNVIRTDELERHINCSNIKTYIGNGHASVILLNPKAVQGRSRNTGHACCTCHRSIKGNYAFCSLSCSLEDIRHVFGTQNASTSSNPSTSSAPSREPSTRSNFCFPPFC